MRRADALLYARTSQHRRAVARSELLIDKALKSCGSWYVAFSGGKDSTCVLHLVRQAAPDTPAVSSVRQWDLPETEQLMSRTSNLHTVTYDGYNGSEWAIRWRDRAQAESRHPGIVWLETKDQIMARGRSEGGVFLGLRSDEASYRRKHLAVHGALFSCSKTGKWHSNPIADWSVLDVWAYLLSRAVDYNGAYDVMEAKGYTLDQQRIGPFDHALGSGALSMIQRCWPDHFNRICAAHPEARAYV